MTAIGSTTISYDAIGNPLTYNGYNLTWHGRQLKEMEKTGSVIQFLYNADGIRTNKIVNGTDHIYTLNGSQIVSEAWVTKNTDDDENVVHFLVYLYDESGSPIGMQYRNTSDNSYGFVTFYFEKNLQGDIIAVYNDNGVKVLSYTYDAWGCHTPQWENSADNNIYAVYNPFRYRGYYYDTETQLYYLQSRYYNPATGRFINADGYINANGDLIGFNMYAYCSNNPIMGYDPTGNGWLKDTWDSVKSFFVNTFGAGATVSRTTEIAKTECFPPACPIQASTGVDLTIVEKKIGDSGKPISVYANGESSNKIVSSSAGILINIGKFSLNISLGLDKIGVTGSWDDGSVKTAIGLVANISELSVEGKCSFTSDDTTTYVQVGVSGWLIAATAYALQTGDVSVYARSPQCAH